MLDLIVSVVVLYLFDRIGHRDMTQTVWALEAQMSEVRSDYKDQANLLNEQFEARLAALALEVKEVRDLQQSSELREANVHAQLEIIDYRLSSSQEEGE